MILFFSKSRIDSKETKLYGFMLISSFFDIVLVLAELIITYYFLDDVNMYLVKGLNKIDFIHYIMWPTLLSLYTIYVTYLDEEKYNKAKKIFLTLDIIAILIEFMLPINIISTKEVMGVTGIGPAFVFLISSFYVIVNIIILIKNYKKIKNKKNLPFLFFLIFIIIAMLLRVYNPTLIVIPAIIVYINMIMYFTIENPDVKLIEEINIAKESAIKASNAKTEFLSNMSHEIRTPLNAIVGFSEALQSDERIPVEAKEDIKDIVMASDSLLEIVNGILDISKIEADKLEIINTTYSPKKVFDELVVLTRGRLGFEKQIEFKTSFSSDIPATLYGDYARVKQIVLNLLTNAVKYTNEGYINFTVECVNINKDLCRLIISVEDSGIGIRKDKIDKLFTKFERLDEERNITIEGTGLGLAITKKLVELMHGKMVVQSIYGKGSKFTVSLDQKIVATKEKEEIKEKTVVKGNYKGKRVLVVDDNKLNLKVAERLLREYNLFVDEVASGFDAIDRINMGVPYNLILMDDMMPKMSGCETLKELKKNKDFHTKTVALTANAISGMREKYLSVGFDDYLAKPIKKEELEVILDKYLREDKK
ncbi:MAG: ATP-binding protein [Bacilli bacterium]|jgi:signal transduction histidine kinase/CheY-like chemotaxis protein|nr:ATP-binding protein [Bacilli bacterium]